MEVPMRFRNVMWTSGAAITIALMFLSTKPASGQAPAREAHSGGDANSWSQPRTPWGDPDFQGIWTNFNSPNTSIEAPGGKRPRLMGGTGDCVPSGATPRPSGGAAIGAGPDHWYENRTAPANARAGLIVEPADGHLPPLTPEADKSRDDICNQIFDSYVYLDPWVRCISRGVPASMFPSAYNNAYQILQTPGYVVILYEMIHDARVIPVGDLPRAGSDIRLWMGNSRARWEGNTLVIETTNFHDRGAIRGHPHSGMLHVVERFTRVDANTMAYETRVEDPKTWTAPWKAAITLNRDDDYQMFEYACHEGNLAVENILSGARLEEKQR
jgi:hypothetical protein